MTDQFINGKLFKLIKIAYDLIESVKEEKRLQIIKKVIENFLQLVMNYS